MTKLGIEDRKHASLEFLATCHCERDRRSSIASHARHDVQEMLGVIRRPFTTGKCEIVTSALTLGPKLLGRRPDQRMEPVHCAGETPKRMTDKIVTANVSQLVKQDSTSTIERPRIAFRRKHNRRVEYAARERHLRVLAP